MTELQLQADCYLWFHNTLIKHRGKFRRVRNETDLKGRLGIIHGMQNKATGIVAGTWDSFLVTNPIVWIEFKSGKNDLTKEQKLFMGLGKEIGWKFFVVRDLIAFKSICLVFFDS